jgi:hypothetical protein
VSSKQKRKEFDMSRKLISNKAFIGSEGSYSENAEILVFNGNELSEEQWETLSSLPDYTRIKYVEAILNGDKDLSHWEED